MMCKMVIPSYVQQTGMSNNLKKTFDLKLIYMKQPKEKQPPSGGKSTVQRIHKDPSPSVCYI